MRYAFEANGTDLLALHQKNWFFTGNTALWDEELKEIHQSVYFSLKFS